MDKIKTTAAVLAVVSVLGTAAAQFAESRAAAQKSQFTERERQVLAVRGTLARSAASLNRNLIAKGSQ